MKFRSTLALLLTFAFGSPVLAHDYAIGGLKIDHPWARPAVSGAVTGAGYLILTNTGKTADRLTGGTTPVASTLEIHEMSMTDGVMRMRPLANGLSIAPGQVVELKPGSYHIMLIGLKRPLNLGDKVPVTLRFEKAGSLKLDLVVQAPSGSSMPMGGAHRHQVQ